MKLLAWLFISAITGFADGHQAKGIVVKSDPASHLLVVSCAAIPGYMEAMEMEFRVRDSKSLAPLRAGSQIEFTIVQSNADPFADHIREVPNANFEVEPMQAAQLTALSKLTESDVKELNVGDRIPDFALTDQAGKTIHLSQFQGKVVALTFGYSRCPNPTYCYRLSNNLAHLKSRAGKDLVLATVMIDPEHDQGTTLYQYAAVFKADPANWHFLTGPLPEIKQVAGMFGMNFWSVDGLITHSLKTVIIDGQGRLAVSLDGNQFTPKQLDDLVQAIIAQRN